MFNKRTNKRKLNWISSVLALLSVTVFIHQLYEKTSVCTTKPEMKNT